MYTAIGATYQNTSVRVVCDQRESIHLLHELEQLRLGGTWVSEKENVDVASQTHPIWEDLLRPAKQQTCYGFLDIWDTRLSSQKGSTHDYDALTKAAKDTRRDALGEQLIKTIATSHLSEILLFLW